MKLLNIDPLELNGRQWKRLAARIDNGFLATSDFLIERKREYILISTDICDDLPMIRVYCDLINPGISKIVYLGRDTDGWQEVQPDTYKSIERDLSEVINKS